LLHLHLLLQVRRHAALHSRHTSHAPWPLLLLLLHRLLLLLHGLLPLPLHHHLFDKMLQQMIPLGIRQSLQLLPLLFTHPAHKLTQ
jgi:hypothetical protein